MILGLAAGKTEKGEEEERILAALAHQREEGATFISPVCPARVLRGEKKEERERLTFVSVNRQWGGEKKGGTGSHSVAHCTASSWGK